MSKMEIFAGRCYIIAAGIVYCGLVVGGVCHMASNGDWWWAGGMASLGGLLSPAMFCALFGLWKNGFLP
jgi:hypothetical protein